MQTWYKEQKGKINESIVPFVKYLKQNQSYRHIENLRYVRMYGNLDIMGLSSTQYARPNPSTVNNRVTLNVIKSCVDTAQSKIAKNRPKPTFLTSGGDFSQQKRAKKLDKFVLGQFYATNIYDTAAQVFLDAGIFGTGVIKIFEEEGQIKVERTIPDELMIDDSEGIYGTPRNLYQVKVVDRDLLRDMFPRFKIQIDGLQSVSMTGFQMSEHYASDQVLVYEAWHLGNKESPGRHVICIDGADLMVEQWDEPTFPFCFFRWCKRPYGFWGQGIAEELLGIQIEINKILRNIQIAQHLLSAPAVYIEQGSGIISQQLSNEIGRIIKFKGTMPVTKVDPIVAPEMYAYLDKLYARAFEIVGISQMSAQSQKPAGLNSGRALREFSDIESSRFVIVSQAWEKFFMDAAKQMIGVARQIYKDDPDFSVKVKGKKFLETIKWADVDLEEDQYVMQIFPTSLLPTEPAGRLEAVQELIAGQMIDPETGMELLDFPDLQRAGDLRFASRDVVRDYVDQIVEDGIFFSPEPFMDLAYAVKYGQMAYNRAKLENTPEEHLELVRRFIEQAIALAEPPPASVPQAEMPMEAPMEEPMDTMAMPQEPQPMPMDGL
jgi:hypothetical protein